MFGIVKVHMCVSGNGGKYLPRASDIALKIDNRHWSVEFSTPIEKDIETRTPSFAQVCIDLGICKLNCSDILLLTGWYKYTIS